MSEITWSLRSLDRAPHFRGAVDGMNLEWVYGWVIAAKSIQEPVFVDIFLYDILILKAATNIHRDDLSQMLNAPVQAGFSAALKDISDDNLQKLLARLKAEGPGRISIQDILRIEIADSGQPLPFSVTIGDIAREELYKALLPSNPHFPGGESKKIALRHELLARQSAVEAPSVKVLAYYLPQFHPFAENNEWWGEGFTEWSNVTTAKPLFKGHYQPHLPADLGFYDLRLDQTHRDQIALAKRYGVSGFCYYYYWFGGKTLMSLPIDRHLEQDLDLDFCLCWANESWSRRWDGSENEVLIAQRHAQESDVEFIGSCLKYFKSPRYIKIDGAPLLQVYRIDLMKDPSATIQRWRKIVQAEGFPDLHLCMVESFGLSDPFKYGCDSSCQFPPHGVVGHKINHQLEGLVANYSGESYDYAEIVRGELARPLAPHLRFRTAMPSWDNTSRKGSAGNVFAGATPALFETWIKHLVMDAQNRLPEDRRFVFINAWNEWAEGAHLEPDRKYGHANLRAVRKALSADNLALAPLIPPPPGMPDPLAETRRYVESLLTTNKMLTRLVTHQTHGLRVGEEHGFVRITLQDLHVEPLLHQTIGLDRLNGRFPEHGVVHCLSHWQGLSLRGWALINGHASSHLMLSLRKESDMDGTRYITSIHQRDERPDVAKALGLGPSALGCGFDVSVQLYGVERGRYEIEIMQPSSQDVRRAHVLASGRSVWIG